MSLRSVASRGLLSSLFCTLSAAALSAQDLEPRRWSHQPIGTSVVGLAYAYTEGSLQFDPVLEIEGASVTSQRVVAAYSHWFEALDKTARVDVFLPFEHTRWDGLLSGSPASRTREGLGDPWVRLSVNLVGSPPLEQKEFMQHYAQRPSNTVAGVALGVMLPLGDYDDQKLLNLGQHRFVLRPQAGVVHTRGPWSYELTGSAFVYGDNDDFFGGNELSQEPLYALQGHIVRSLPNRWWVSISGGFSWGGETAINGVSKDDDRNYVLSAVSFGLPIAKTQSLKVVYTRGDTKEQVGLDSNSLILSWSARI